MEYLTPLDKELDNLSNEELRISYNKKIKSQNISPAPYFSIFAKRIHFFKDIIFQEVIDKKNTVVKLKIFKPSWMIMLSVLDYCEDENILMELGKHIKTHWEKEDFESFINYIKKEQRFYKYFE